VIFILEGIEEDCKGGGDVGGPRDPLMDALEKCRTGGGGGGAGGYLLAVDVALGTRGVVIERGLG
jgi:hypothetical protein